MRRFAALCLMFLCASFGRGADVLVETESFGHKGGTKKNKPVVTAN